jgi:hypothetical protein
MIIKNIYLLEDSDITAILIKRKSVSRIVEMMGLEVYHLCYVCFLFNDATII